jgi:hypothetical protein
VCALRRARCVVRARASEQVLAHPLFDSPGHGHAVLLDTKVAARATRPPGARFTAGRYASFLHVLRGAWVRTHCAKILLVRARRLGRPQAVRAKHLIGRGPRRCRPRGSQCSWLVGSTRVRPHLASYRQLSPAIASYRLASYRRLSRAIASPAIAVSRQVSRNTPDLNRGGKEPAHHESSRSHRRITKHQPVIRVLYNGYTSVHMFQGRQAA